MISPRTRNTNTICTNSLEPLSLQRGYNPEKEPETFFPDENGRYTVEITESDRLVIYLGDLDTQSDAGEYKKQIEPDKVFRDGGRGEPCVHPAFSDNLLMQYPELLKRENTHPGFHYGYLVSGGELKPLPIGSTLDRWRGVFYWQLGPGFYGDYDMVFLIEDREGNITRKNIIIRVVPKFSLSLPGDG